MQHKTLKKHDYTEMEGRALGIKYEALFKKLLKKICISLAAFRVGSSSCHAQSIVVTYSLVVTLPRGMWDLSFPTRDQTHILGTGRQILNHWTTREVPKYEVLD